MPARERSIDVVSVGEAIVDLLPSRRGPLWSVPSFERHSGGAQANVAVGVARLGVKCAFVGAVGADPFGTFLVEQMRSDGIETRWLRQVVGARTELAFVSLDDDGKPRFFPAGGRAEDLALSPDALEGLDFQQVRVLHVSTGLLRAPTSREITFEAMRRARRAGCLVAFDPNLRLHHWPDPAPLRRDVDEMVSLAHVVKLSSDEIEFVSGTGDPRAAAQRLVAAGPSLAVVTLGPDGCLWARPGETGRLSARPCAAVDTTGAGDGFHAAMLAAMATALRRQLDPFTLETPRLERLLGRALEAGTRVCEQMGAVAGLPTLAELGSLDV